MELIEVYIVFDCIFLYGCLVVLLHYIYICVFVYVRVFVSYLYICVISLYLCLYCDMSQSIGVISLAV